MSDPTYAAPIDEISRLRARVRELEAQVGTGNQLGERSGRDLRSRNRLEQDTHKHNADRGQDTSQLSVLESSASRVVNELNAVVQAASEANAEFVKGAVTVLGNVLLGINNISSRTNEQRPARRQPTTTGQSGTTVRTADADRNDTTTRVQDAGDVATGLIRQVASAVNDGASVLTRTGQRFQDRYEEVASKADQAQQQHDTAAYGYSPTQPASTQSSGGI